MPSLKTALFSGILVVLTFGLGLVDAVAAADPQPASSSSAAVRKLAGRVLDGDGKALEGAGVWLFGRETASQPEQRQGTVTTGADGQFRFENLGARGYVVAVAAPGFARAYRVVSLRDGDRLASDMALRKGGILSLRVRKADGRPIVGARTRWVWQQDANGSFQFEGRAFEEKQFDLVIPPSDAAGKIQLPPMPLGASISLEVEHPDYVQGQLHNVIVEPTKSVEVAMQPGVRLTLRVSPPELLPQASGITLRLDRVPVGAPSTYDDLPLPFDKEGVARITVQPGRYSQLTLQHPDYLAPPRVTARGDQENFVIEPGRNDDFTFKLRRKVEARGRVVDQATGKPVADEIVIGEVLVTSAPDASGKTALEWAYADSQRTDAKGEYRLRLATGLARIACRKDNFASDPLQVQVSVKAPGPVAVRDISLRPLPKVQGRVIGPDGAPAHNTVVRFRGPQLRWVNPTLTDDRGRFELPLPFLPLGEHNKPVFAHPLVAFHAYEPLGARTEIRLDRPETLSNVTLKLEPEPYERQLDEIANEWRDWERKGSSHGHASTSARGGIAPELDCRLWLNVPRGTSRLADLRGRYVLLDFWTTWCGPCRADYPSVELAYKLYKDHGLTVVGVHDNSVEPDRIQKHVETHKMSVPIAIDQADGRTLSAYNRECGVNSFPSYVLVGPDGTIVNADKQLPGPLLRSFKIEIIRAHVMGDSARAARQ